MDGVKLYSKSLLEGSIVLRSLLVLSLGIVLMVPMYWLVSSLSSGVQYSIDDSDLIVCFVVCELAVSSFLFVLSHTSSYYSSLGIVRHVRGLIFSSVMIESLFVLGVIVFKVLSVAGYSYILCGLDSYLVVLYSVVVVVVAFSSGRSPFDLSEAESELVCGVTTELAGYSFVVILIVDYLELIVLQLVFLVLGTLIFESIFYFMFSFFLLFVGRLILCRVLVSEVYRIVYLVMLW